MDEISERDLFEQRVSDRIEYFRKEYQSHRLTHSFFENNTNFLRYMQARDDYEADVQEVESRRALLSAEYRMMESVFEQSMEDELSETFVPEEREAIEKTFADARPLLEEMKRITLDRQDLQPSDEWMGVLTTDEMNVMRYFADFMEKHPGHPDEFELLHDEKRFQQDHIDDLYQIVRKAIQDRYLTNVPEELRDSEKPASPAVDMADVAKYLLSRWRSNAEALGKFDKLPEEKARMEETEEPLRKRATNFIKAQDLQEQLKSYREELEGARTRWSNDSAEYTQMLADLRALEDCVKRGVDRALGSPDQVLDFRLEPGKSKAQQSEFGAKLLKLRESAAGYYNAKLGQDKNENRMKRFNVSEALMQLGDMHTEHEKRLAADAAPLPVELADPVHAAERLAAEFRKIELKTDDDVKEYGKLMQMTRDAVFSMHEKEGLTSAQKKDMKLLEGALKVNELLESEKKALDVIRQNSASQQDSSVQAPTQNEVTAAKSTVMLVQGLRNLMNESAAMREKMLSGLSSADGVEKLRTAVFSNHKKVQQLEEKVRIKESQPLQPQRDSVLGK